MGISRGETMGDEPETERLSPTAQITRLQIKPNPVRDRATLSFTTAHPLPGATLRIVDATGRLVDETVLGALAPGRHAVVWRRGRSGCVSGVYCAQIHTPTGTSEGMKFLVVS
jgi:hypothetical protein